MRRRTLRDEVHDELLARILDGSLPPGRDLRDVDVARELDVSRTPVREAILQLVGEGFVDTDPNRWTRVAAPTPASVASWYEIMATLEGLAAEKAAGRMTPAALDRLGVHTGQLAVAIERDDPVAARLADDEFHRLIVEAAGRPELERIIEDLRSKLRWSEVAFFSDDELRHDAVTEHRAIIVALQRGNAATAAKLVRSNWENGAVILRPEST